MDRIKIKVVVGILCVVAVAMLQSIQMAQASGFVLKVNLYDGKTTSGRVDVSVISDSTNVKKSHPLNVGKIVTATHNSNIEHLKFVFSDKALPPNGAFTVCAASTHGTNCEHADRHGTVSSAIIWIQVP